MRLVLILMMALMLSGCGQKKPPKVEVDFNGPTSGPNWDDIKPEYGPNDPVPQ